MDPISAIGVASAVVQFIQFGMQVAARLEEYSLASPSEVPKPLQAICNQLPLLLDSLRRIGSEEKIARLDTDTRCILKGVVSGCNSQIREIEEIINSIVRMPGESARARLHKVLVGMKKEEKVWKIERNLNTYISVLVLHHVVDQGDAPARVVDDLTYFMVSEKRLAEYNARDKLTAELDTVFHDAARSQVQKPVHLLLVGNPGAGKTQLALEYCHQAHNLGQFKSVFWIDASSKENVLLGLESIAAAAHRSRTGTRAEKLEFVQKFLADLWHPWLLVLDNYDHYAHFDVNEVLPKNGTGGILFTTRDDSAAILGTTMKVTRFLTAGDQEKLDSRLTSAIQSKETEKIKSAIEAGANVDTMIWGEWPCVHRAALLGLQDAVQMLLAAGANQDIAPKMGRPLHWAASGGYPTIVRMLLEREDEEGYEPKLSDTTDVFKAAVDKGKVEVVELLLKYRKVDLTSKDQYGRSALVAAATRGNLELVKLLRRQAQWAKNDNEVNKAMLAAAHHGNLEVAKHILEDGGANVNFRDDSDGDGGTVLYEAAKMNREADKPDPEAFITYLLKQHNADPTLATLSDQSTPLHEAAVREHSVEALLRHGANPAAEDKQGYTPLINTVRYNSQKTLTLLLEKADTVRDPVAKAHWLDHALRYACRNSNDREYVLPILEAGANIDGADWRGMTGLVLAIDNDHTQVARLLVKKGAKQDIPDQDGRLALPLAAERGQELVVKELLRKHKTPDIKNGKGDTALGLAAGKGHLKVVEILLSSGADPELENKFGDTPLDIAEEKKQEKVVELLDKLSFS